ncbi:hydrolase [Malassezia pachydermatis]
MNAFSFSKRLKALQKECKDVAEFVFANGPIQVSPLPTAENPEPGPPNPNDPIEKQARSWWRSTGDVYEHWDESLAYLQQFCREHGPFDGVLGFSQGASVAGVVSATLNYPDKAHGFSDPIQDRPFLFSICVSGFRPADKRFDPIFEKLSPTPTLVVLGMNDQIVSPTRTQEYINCCQQIRVLRHPGEHYLPSPAPWRRFFYDFFVSFLNNTGEWKTVPPPDVEGISEAVNEAAMNKL